MKQKILAICLFVFVFAFSITNTLILEKLTGEMIEEIEAIEINQGDLEKLYKIEEVFSKNKSYIALTVSHDDLTNIEDCFAELRGLLSVEDYDGAEVTKCRLISFLSHLRRLVGFNIDTII